MSIDDSPGAGFPGSEPPHGVLDPGLVRLIGHAVADADAVAARVDHDAVLAAVRSAPGPAPGRRLPFGVTACLAAGACGALWAVSGSTDRQLWFDALLVLLFVLLPVLLVVGWHRQARRPGTSGRVRVPRTVPGWALQIEAQGLAAARRATEVGRLADRLTGLRDRAAAGPAELDELAGGLTRAAAAARALADRTACGAVEARRFARRCRRDGDRGHTAYGRLPWTVDPRQVGALLDELTRELRRAGDEAGDLPLRLAGQGARPSAAATAAGIADELGHLRRRVQLIRRPLLTDCRQLLVAFDTLHGLVTARAIARIVPGPGATLAATAAMAASTLPRRRTHRAAARTAFLQAPGPAARSPWRWICGATTAAVGCAPDRRPAGGG